VKKAAFLKESLAKNLAQNFVLLPGKGRSLHHQTKTKIGMALPSLFFSKNL
jgi:hypothetical protein